jgi:hypothetical protein
LKRDLELKYLGYQDTPYDLSEAKLGEDCVTAVERNPVGPI